MKKLKPVAICLILALIILQHILKASYYKQLFGDDNYWFNNFRSILNISGAVFVIILDVFILVLGVMSLTSTNKATQDRAYSIFRYVYIMQGIMIFPVITFEIIYYAESMFADLMTGATILFMHCLWITLVILLIISKPEKPIQKVNLQEYDMVAYTTIGHRFVHYLIDVLFLLPTLIFSFQFMSIARFGDSDVLVLLFRLIFLLSYLLYCFFSEAIFNQTLGKMVTRSCVVSDGAPLTIGRIFRRTMARLIPFDPIAFLFGAKWHDSASATSVVYVDSWEKAFDGDEKNN
jgi:hypothetical protein